MPQFDENDLTAAVVKSFENTPDKRAKFLLQELVKSLHDFVRKTDLSFEEWERLSLVPSFGRLLMSAPDGITELPKRSKSRVRSAEL